MTADEIWDELVKASRQYEAIPEYLRPVVTVSRGWGKTAALEALKKELDSQGIEYEEV